MNHNLILNMLLIVGIINVSCSTKTQNKNNYLDEIRSTELAFSKMALEEGVLKAFLAFADDSCMLKRGGEVLMGKEGIKKAYTNFSRTATLQWAPDFVDVSESGNLGYTYGTYTYTDIDSLGVESTSEGIFHTVWKRQEDGKWKFVWD